MPAWQSKQSSSATFALVVEYLPCGHSEHAAVPFDALNVPGGHARHDKDSKPSVVEELDEFVKVKPSTHRQSVSDAAPGSESELGGQAMQPELPSTLAEYVPEGQALQVLIDVAPMAVENRPAPHLRHPMLLFAGANVPAGQGMHPAVPFDALNVPGRQGTHLFWRVITKFSDWAEA